MIIFSYFYLFNYYSIHLFIYLFFYSFFYFFIFFSALEADATTAIEKLQGQDLKGRKLKLESAVKKARGRNALAAKEDSSLPKEDSSLPKEEVAVEEKEVVAANIEKIEECVPEIEGEGEKKDKKLKKEKKIKKDTTESEIPKNDEKKSKKMKIVTETVIFEKAKVENPEIVLSESLVKETKIKKSKKDDVATVKVVAPKLSKKEEIPEKVSVGTFHTCSSFFCFHFAMFYY